MKHAGFKGFARRTSMCVAALSMVVLGFAGIQSGAGASGLTAPTAGMKPQTSIGKGEGKLNLIAWSGYAQPQWVKPFEKNTGCEIGRASCRERVCSVV